MMQGPCQRPSADVDVQRPFAGCTFVPDEARADVMRAVPGLRLSEVDADHFTVLTAPGALAALDMFLAPHDPDPEVSHDVR